MKQEGAEGRAGGYNSGRHEEKAKRGREGRDKLLKPAQTEWRVVAEKKKAAKQLRGVEGPLQK